MLKLFGKLVKTLQLPCLLWPNSNKTNNEPQIVISYSSKIVIFCHILLPSFIISLNQLSVKFLPN
jgi:hypothetical protein